VNVQDLLTATLDDLEKVADAYATHARQAVPETIDLTFSPAPSQVTHTVRLTLGTGRPQYTLHRRSQQTHDLLWDLRLSWSGAGVGSADPRVYRGVMTAWDAPDLAGLRVLLRHYTAAHGVASAVQDRRRTGSFDTSPGTPQLLRIHLLDLAVSAPHLTPEQGALGDTLAPHWDGTPADLLAVITSASA
jgi:hypothetical protein